MVIEIDSVLPAQFCGVVKNAPMGQCALFDGGKAEMRSFQEGAAMRSSTVRLRFDPQV